MSPTVVKNIYQRRSRIQASLTVAGSEKAAACWERDLRSCVGREELTRSELRGQQWENCFLSVCFAFKKVL